MGASRETRYSNTTRHMTFCSASPYNERSATPLSPVSLFLSTPMSTDKVRFGILGVAKINDRLIPSFARTQHASLAAIASRDRRRAEAAARAAGIPRAFGSYAELLADPAIDAVYIPL